MTLQYVRFDPPHLLREYVGKAGPHLGNALPSAGYDALADAANTGNPPQYVVIGEWRDGDTSWLDLGVTVAWLHAASSYRADENGRLHWRCPTCGVGNGGKHAIDCPNR